MKFNKVLAGLVFTGTALGSLNFNFAQDFDFSSKSHDIPSIQQAAVIDGLMNEPHWQDALKIDITYETTPAENTPAGQKTTAFVYENGVNLYIAFRAEDTQADQIRAYIRDRDSAYQDDFVGVQFDTFNDEQRAYEFFVNARGSQMDLIFDETSGNEDDSWDAIWDAQSVIDANGYTVEIEIPFSNLRFVSGNQIKTWSMEFLRVHPRDERRIYRNTPRSRDRNCAICQWDKFNGFANAVQGNQLELNPVLTVAKSESRDEVSGQLESNGTDYEPGLNVRWGVTPQLTFNGTINPDFSQVEADDPQLGVNETFALFFPEKRPFFQEGSDYYNTYTRAVYTRNITDPEYGAKITGKQGNHLIGAFGVKDKVTNILIPGTFGSSFTSIDDESNALVARYRYDYNSDFNLGALTTYRDAGDYSNTVAGVDGFYRWNDKNRLRVQYLTSETDNTVDMQNDFGLDEEQSGDAIIMRYNYNTRNWFAYLNYVDFDQDFRADLGFIRQTNFDRKVIGGGHTWYSDDKWWNRLEIRSDWDITHDNDGNVLEKEFEAFLEGNGKYQSYGNFGFVIRNRFFDNQYFDEHFITSYINFFPKGGLRFDFGWDIGERVDFSNSALSDSYRLSPGFSWSYNEHLQFIANHTYRVLDTNNIRKLAANLSDLRVVYQFNTRSFLRFTAQYQDIENEVLDPMSIDFGTSARDKSFNKQLLYSYKLNPRTVFFLGYSDLADNGNPQNNLEIQQRGLFMKLGYVFDY